MQSGLKKSRFTSTELQAFNSLSSVKFIQAATREFGADVLAANKLNARHTPDAQLGRAGEIFEIVSRLHDITSLIYRQVRYI